MDVEAAPAWMTMEQRRHDAAAVAEGFTELTGIRARGYARSLNVCWLIIDGGPGNAPRAEQEEDDVGDGDTGEAG